MANESNSPAALILASPRSQDRIITGLRLSERARRVAAKAGIPAERIVIVRSPEELSAARPALERAPLLFIRAARHVVAKELVEPLRPGEPGQRAAFHENGQYAGAAQLDPSEAEKLLDSLGSDFDAGDEALASSWQAVEVGPRARHPAGTRSEARAADAWQFELTHKRMDGIYPTYIWRPLARPLTRIFLRLPFSPNQISLASGIVSVTGCVIAGFSSWHVHVLGLAILILGIILDTCDGEVARLRLEQSETGAWIDAICDDIARLALISGIGFHVSATHPDWPILWITGGALALTLTSMMLIYWYCIFVIGSSSNQDYEAVLGVGNNVEVEGERKSIGRLLGDALTTMARRAFIDLAVFLLALAGLSWISFAGLAVGSLVAVTIILPAHFRLLRQRREARPRGA